MGFKSGFNRVNKVGGPDTGQINVYKAKNSLTRNLYTGAAVRVSAGYVKDVTVNTATVLGVMDGAQWIDPVTGRPVWSLYVPSGTSSGNGNLDSGLPATFGIAVYVCDDPGQEYVIQANASVPASALGAFAQVSVTGGSAYSGRSNSRLDYSAAGTSSTNALLRITGCPVFPFNAGYGVSVGQTSDGPVQNQWDVANTWTQVVFNRTVIGSKG